MTSLEVAIASVHQLDVMDLARVKATCAARIESLTERRLPASRLKVLWQFLVQPHRYALARDRENQRLMAQNAALLREVRRLEAIVHH